VRASAGDNRLGGEDFNELLVSRMRETHKAAFGAAGRDDALYQRLRAAAERARRTLSSQDSAVMSLTWNDQTFEEEITAEAFDKLSEGLLARLREPVLRALRDGKIQSAELDEVVLVGGATRMPTIRRAVARMFSRFPAMNINPDEAIARGAAIQAGLKARDSALREVVLTDVCPFSLGVEVAEDGPNGSRVSGLFSPILERNTVIPASRVRNYTTRANGQTQILLKVYQGESRWVKDNVLLGTLEVPVPARPAGESAVDCRFTYDINGLLEVDTHVLMTGERRNLIIADDDLTASDNFEALRAALAALKVHPRENAANLAALARAGRCYEDTLGEAREYISRVTLVFEAALDKQDPRGIETARAELTRALDAVEGQTFL
jgi:molecular chaperone HscC